jgi:uncharacterized membrane protein YdjX (TVP38/TMEM64 family)
MDTLRHAAALQSNPIAPLVVIGAHIVAGLVLVPVTFLITVSTMAFGPWRGITYWLFGCLGSAMLTFVLARFLGTRHRLKHPAGGSGLCPPSSPDAGRPPRLGVRRTTWL